MNDRVLVADDEADVLDLVSFNLRTAGFDVLREEDGSAALATARSRQPALAVLDVMMPEMNGIEVCRLLKADDATAKIPVILLTARTSEDDRIRAFECGADDYVTKPFSPRELVLRVQAILRRRIAAPVQRPTLEAGSIAINLDQHEVLVGGRPIDLTAMEFRLLTTLMERRGRLQSRNALLSAVWGFECDVESRTIDTHLRRLREKLGRAGEQIRTVRGFGYRLDEV